MSLPYETLTPILGEAATEYIPESETTPEFMNGKFAELLENDKNLDNKINVLNNNRGYLSSVSLSNNTDFNTITQNGKYVVNTNINSPVTSSSLTYSIDVTSHANASGEIIRCTQTATAINSNYKTYKRVLNSGVWQPWEPIATTTKTSFLCSANTGYTIINQDCYTMNGEYNILLRIAKTDGGTFSTSEQVVATVPINILNTVNSPFTVIARNSSSIWTDYVTAQLIGATKEIRVTASGSSTNNIILSCRGRLL